MEPVQAQSGSVDAPRRLFDPSTLLTAVLLVGAGSVMITVIASSPVSLYWRVLTFLFALAFMGLYYFKARQDARQHFPSDLQRSIPVYYTYGVNEEELDRIMAEFRSDVRNPGMIDIELLAITRTDQKIPLFKSWAIGLVTMAIAVILLVSPSIPGPPSTSSTGAVTSTPLELPWYLPLTVLYVGLLYIRVTWVKWRSWSFEVTNQGLTLRRIFSSWL